MEKYLCTTKDGFKVYYDDEKSHAVTHFKKHPELFDLVIKALENHSFNNNETRFDVDMKQNVGMSDLVITDDKDEIIYAKRPLRDIYYRFVKKRKPEPTTFITIELNKVNNEKCRLFTAYIGQVTPPTPRLGKDTPEAREFWKNHALVYNEKEVIKGTETHKCPWE